MGFTLGAKVDARLKLVEARCAVLEKASGDLIVKYQELLEQVQSGLTSARGAQQPSKLPNAEFDSPGPLQAQGSEPVMDSLEYVEYIAKKVHDAPVKRKPGRPPKVMA